MLLIKLLANIQLYRQAQKWAKQYSLIKSKTVLPLFIGTLLSYPHGTQKKLLTLFKLTELIFVIDDIYDENLFDSHNLRDQILNNNKFSFKDSLEETQFTTFFDDIKDSLFSDIHNESFRTKWLDSVGDMLKAMELEKDTKTFATLTEYLETSKKSVGLYMYNLALALLMGIDINSNNTIVNEIIDHSAKFTRFSNDIRSYERESEQGKINSINILIKQGKSLDEAEAILRQKATQEYMDLFTLKINNDLITCYKKNILVSIDFINQLYQSDDFRDSKTKAFIKLLLNPLAKFGEAQI